MGLIIGEETGGTKIFRANAIGKKLANSRVYVRMSTTKLFTACYSEELQGVLPNVEYSPNIFQLLSDMDTQLLYALRVIKQVKEKREGAKKGASKS